MSPVLRVLLCWNSQETSQGGTKLQGALAEQGAHIQLAAVPCSTVRIVHSDLLILRLASEREEIQVDEGFICKQ